MKIRTIIFLIIIATAAIIGCKIYEYNQPQYIASIQWRWCDGVNLSDVMELSMSKDSGSLYTMDYPKIYRNENGKCREIGKIKFCFAGTLWVEITDNPRFPNANGLVVYEKHSWF